MFDKKELIELTQYFTYRKKLKLTEQPIENKSTYNRRPDILAYEIIKDNNPIRLSEARLLYRISLYDLDTYSDVGFSFAFIPIKQGTLNGTKIVLAQTIAAITRDRSRYKSIWTKELLGL